MATYCKNCGYEVNENGICMGCGKRYVNKSNLLIFILSLTTVVSIASSVYFFDQSKESKSVAVETMRLMNEIDSEFTMRFGDYTNPETGESIDGVYSYLEALDAQMKIDGTAY